MIFNAYIDATPEEEIKCRIFSPPRRKWWKGKDVAGVDLGWSTDSEAFLQTLPSINDSTHAGPIEYPEFEVSVEYMLTGDSTPIGRDDVVTPTTVVLSAQDKADIAASINDGLVSPIVIPLVQGTQGVIELTPEKRVHLKRGDSYRLTFSLGRNCNGWTGCFGGKLKHSDETYCMEVREVVFTDQATGTGYIDLTTDDTSKPGTVYGELELRNGVETNTAESYTFTIERDVVR